MKKLFFLCAVMVCSVNSFAQMWDNAKPDKRVTFGVRAGINNSTWSDADAIHSWGGHCGVNVDCNIVKSFAIETGLFLSLKGFEDELHDNTLTFPYIQIPAIVLYRIPLTEDFHLQVKPGVYFGLGDPADAGVSFGLGFSYKKFYIGTQYEHGLSVQSYDDGHYYYEGKSRNFTLSVGYDF